MIDPRNGRALAGASGHPAGRARHWLLAISGDHPGTRAARLRVVLLVLAAASAGALWAIELAAGRSRHDPRRHEAADAARRQRERSSRSSTPAICTSPTSAPAACSGVRRLTTDDGSESSPAFSGPMGRRSRSARSTTGTLTSHRCPRRRRAGAADLASRRRHRAGFTPDGRACCSRRRARSSRPATPSSSPFQCRAASRKHCRSPTPARATLLARRPAARLQPARPAFLQWKQYRGGTALDDRGSTRQATTPSRRSRSRRPRATTPIRCGSATRSTSARTATASSTLFAYDTKSKARSSS